MRSMDRWKSHRERLTGGTVIPKRGARKNRSIPAKKEAMGRPRKTPESKRNISPVRPDTEEGSNTKRDSSGRRAYGRRRKVTTTIKQGKKNNALKRGKTDDREKSARGQTKIVPKKYPADEPNPGAEKGQGIVEPSPPKSQKKVKRGGSGKSTIKSAGEKERVSI